MIRIQISSGSQVLEREIAADRLVFGRSESCDVSLPSAGFLSREHLEIVIDGSSCIVRDLNSRHGVSMDGELVSSHELNAGDVVSVGRLTLELLAFRAEYRPREPRCCPACGRPLVGAEQCCSGVADTEPLEASVQFSTDHFPGYQLVRQLGQGGMGIVFQAVRESDGAECAIKVIHPHLASQDSYLVRFVEETRALTVLDHPNIVRIHESGAAQGLAYIDMELVKGESVQSRLVSTGALSEKIALQIIWQMTLALDYAAARKIIHGDVKPANFILAAPDRAKLCDFGLASQFEWTASRELVAPAFTGRKGTPAYAAPERFRRDTTSTVTADIYSLGVSLYQMVTGRLPFGGNKQVLEARRAKSTPRDVRTIKESIRPSTAFLIQMMMESDPANRYTTWRAVQDDLSLLV